MTDKAKGQGNRRIAELLGWRLEKCHIIGSADEFRWMGAPPFPVTDDMKYTTGRSGARYIDTPDYFGSVDAAWQLVADIDGFTLTVDKQGESLFNGERFEASIRDPIYDDGFIAVERAKEPAEAICKAWLIWHEVTGK